MNKALNIDKKIFYKYFSKKIGSIIILSCIIMLGTLVNSITPYLFGNIIDAIVKGQIDQILKLIKIMFLLEVICAGLSAIENYYGNKITLKITYNIKRDIINKILFINMDNLNKYSKGELINRVEQDSNEIASTHISFLTGILQTFIKGIISILFAFRISMLLTIISIIYLPLSYLGGMIYKNKLQRFKLSLKEFHDTYLSFINEILQNIEGIKSYCLENKIALRINDLYKRNLSLSNKYFSVQCGMNGMQNILSTILDCVMLLVAAMLINNKKMTVGSFVSFNQYIRSLLQVFSQVMGYVMGFISCQVNIDRISRLLNEPIENMNESKTVRLSHIKNIRINSVFFKYDQKVILENLNLEIKENGLYSIVGLNGAGKSTLFKIILKLYTIQSGKIYINDQEIDSYSISQLRNEISYIAKDPFLFNDTIKFNLTLGKELDEQYLIEVTRRVGLLEFISELNNGLNTYIGENGIILSSGTKQKISIARALIKNTSMWMCDEIT